MKRIGTIFLFSAMLIFILSGYAVAQNILVYDFQAEGIDASTVKIARALIVSELSAVKGVVIVPPPAGESCYEEFCAKTTRAKMKADAVVIGQVYKIGETTSMKLIAAWTSESLHYSVSMKDIGEIDRVAPRLAQAIVKKMPYGQTATVETVTSKEQETFKRVQGDFSWGPVLGGLAPINNSYGGARFFYQITLSFRYETSQLGFEFDTGVYFNDEGKDKARAREWPLDFSMLYYFSGRDAAPYIGGSAGIHWIGVTKDLDKKDDEGDSLRKSYDGWTPSVSAFVGYELLRTHTFHFLARAGYRTGFISLGGPGAHGPFLSLGFVF